MRIDSGTGFGTGEGSGQLAGGHVAQPGIQGHAPDVTGRERPHRVHRQALVPALLLTMLVLGLNLAVWAFSHPSVSAPDFRGNIGGMAYNGFQRWDSPLEGRFPSEESLRKDMQVMATRTDRLRTYSSSEMPRLPALANAVGLKLTAGVWIDTRPENNQREIDAAVLAVENHRNIERLIVGNESLLHGLVTTDELIAYLDQVRRRAHVPVSTAEPWHVWLRNPRLADHVDYIAVHLLPYWEGVPHAVAVDYAFERLDEVRRRFPGKQVVIGEIGWPSQGDRYDGAGANRVSQAVFIREFLARSAGMNLDYFMMEAVDQPWKRATEGRVGSYWGMMDASREMKFPLAGPIPSDPNWLLKASLASLLAALPVLLFLRRFGGMRLPSRLFFAALIQGGSSLVIWLLAIPFEYYLRPVDWIGVIVLVPSVLLMVLILLANGFEFAEMFWRGNLGRRFEAKPMPAHLPQPKVSIHLACCNEPPDMVIATINSLLALDYQNYEVLVIDNNTRDEAKWLPVQEHVARLDQRFRFFHLPHWPGYKAGALNFALSQTSADAQIIGVVDADYLVRPHWLRDLVGHFEPGVAVVQAPQSHRDWGRQVFQRMMNWEFDGFFRIGMHHRNERDAIIQHGTMMLVRADLLRASGNWSEWCICEDTELGLRLMQAGWSSVYVDEVMGQGLTPDHFAAFRKQRRRWAQGGMQILRGHASELFTWRSKAQGATLTPAQRYHFVAGWMSWFGDALHLVFAFAAMFWTIGIMSVPHLVSLPILLFMLPVFVFFVGKAVMGPLLYWARVPCSFRDALGAAVAGMGLSHGIATGVFAGLTGRSAVFEITAKGVGGKAGTAGSGRAGAGWMAALAASRAGKALSMAREEAGLLLAMTLCIVGMAVTRKADHIESALWMSILALQAVPYLAAVTCAWLSGAPARATESEEQSGRQPVPVRHHEAGSLGNGGALAARSMTGR